MCDYAAIITGFISNARTTHQSRNLRSDAAFFEADTICGEPHRFDSSSSILSGHGSNYRIVTNERMSINEDKEAYTKREHLTEEIKGRPGRAPL